MHDPQNLTIWGSIKAVLALGRIPLASEVPLWTLFGCLLSSRLYPSATGYTNWLAVIQCMLVTWGTNVSINYGNEYFDWEMDRVGQIRMIREDIEARERSGKRKPGENDKIMGNTTRIIHDGTFPPITALFCSIICQAALIAMIVTSRRNSNHSPFHGIALQIGIISTILSHEYVGPPLRLHYNGFGELVSALFLCPIAILFGMMGHYTAVHHPLSFSTFASPTSQFHIPISIWTLLSALYFLEQARILIMHIHDIDADIKGGKRTFVSRMGYSTSAKLYVVFNMVSLLLFGLHVRGLQENQGIWKGGLAVVMAYSVPVTVTTANTLFKGPSFLPRLPPNELPKIVSLQVLLTPVVLSTAVAFGGL